MLIVNFFKIVLERFGSIFRQDISEHIYDEAVESFGEEGNIDNFRTS